VQVLHRAVTRLAGDARRDVAVVAELHVVGHAMDADPIDRLLVLPVLLELLDALEVGAELGVAAHARLDRGNSGHAAAVRTTVTVEAIDLVLAGVQRVAERDRLHGPWRVGIRREALSLVGGVG
jgi:hypothetical protein